MVNETRPDRPPAWNLRPGEMRTVVLVGASRRLEPLRRRLPSEWPTLYPAQRDCSLAGASLVCVVVSEEGERVRRIFVPEVRGVGTFAVDPSEPVLYLGLLEEASILSVTPG